VLENIKLKKEMREVILRRASEYIKIGPFRIAKAVEVVASKQT
jgi:hypothetical protein